MIQTRKVFRLVLLTSLAVSVLSMADQIYGQAQDQCNGAYAWTPPTTSTSASGPASAPANDTAFNPQGHSYSYFAQGTKVDAARNVADADGPAGTIKWTWQNPSTIVSTPTPVLLSPIGVPQEVILVTALDGVLYKINADDEKTASVVDTRRVDPNRNAMICSTDQLFASPVVQLYNSSNALFKANVDASGGNHAAADDVVYVITNNQCGDHTHNRVIAYWASSLSVKWTFNANFDNGVGNSPYSVDASRGCALDYGTNSLFCGTALQDPGGTQDSLWAINSVTGARRWAANAGSIVSQVTLHNGRLYVAGNGTSGGQVQAFDLAADPQLAFRGKPLWTSPLAFPGYNFVRNLWPVGDTLLVVDTNSTLSRIQDQGSAGTILWQVAPESGVHFTSGPVAVESLGKAYIGRSDGTIQEIDLATGQAGQVVVVNQGVDVFDLSLDIEGAASDFNRLVVVADASPGIEPFGVVTRLIIPFCRDSTIPSTTTLSSSANPSMFGHNVTFTATVAPLGNAKPSGTVTFLDGTTPLGPAVILTNGAPATFMTSTLTAGMHMITAQYNGDTNYSASKSAALIQTVAGDFSISAKPASLSVVQGASGASTISTSVTSGVAKTVALIVSGAPRGATATLTPTSVAGGGSSTLSVNAGTAAVGTYTLTVTGTAASATHSTSVTLTVTPRPVDFSISVSPSNLKAGQGSVGVFKITVAGTKGFAGKVKLSVSGLPSREPESFLPASVTGSGSSFLIIFVVPRQPSGNFPLTITGTSGALSHSANATLNVP